MDTRSATVQEAAFTGALEDSANQMFMGNNKATDAINGIVHVAERAHPLIGLAANLEFPIRRVSMNLLGRSIEYLGFGIPEGMRKLSKVPADVTLSAADAHAIKLMFGRGSVGVGAGLLAGYIGLKRPSWCRIAGFYRSKHSVDSKGKEMEPGSAEIFGHHVTKLAGDNPLGLAMQFQATIGNEMADGKSFTDAYCTALDGLAIRVPGVFLFKRLKKAQNASQMAGIVANDVGVPPYPLALAARELDQKGGPGFKSDPMGYIEGNYKVGRSPKTFSEYIEEGIPGLRQNVGTYGKAKKYSESERGSKF
jgi:hypothetical protein